MPILHLIGSAGSWANQIISQHLSAMCNPTNLFSWNTCHDSVRLYIFSHDRSRRDKAIFPQFMSTDNGRIRANRNAFPDHSFRIFIPTIHLRPRCCNVGKHHAGTAENTIFERDALVNGHVILDFASVTYIDVRTSYCLLYTSPSPRDQRGSRMPSSA